MQTRLYLRAEDYMTMEKLVLTYIASADSTMQIRLDLRKEDLMIMKKAFRDVTCIWRECNESPGFQTYSKPYTDLHSF